MSRVLRCSIALLTALSLVPVASAAPGADAPPGGSGVPPNRRLLEDVSGNRTSPQRGLRPAIEIEGRVVDSGGAPMSGILVKAFANGTLAATTTTASHDGSFRLSANPMQSREGSSVIWFQSPDPSAYVDSEIVLWVGDADKAKDLFPPCTEIVPLTDGIAGRIEVTMRSEEERRKIVLASGCLGALPTDPSLR